MDEKHETTADIIAEMRGIHVREFQEYAARIEVAHRRERGNAAKLREACANIAEYARSAMCHTTDAHVLGYLNQIEGRAKAALAEPPRNCDVGMVYEQTKRKFEFCQKQGSCGNCSLNRGQSITPCVLAWAQMPYKEGGAK